MSLQKNTPSSSRSPISVDTDPVPSFATSHAKQQQNATDGELSEAAAAWRRWNPTREQIEILQRLYFQEGVRNPNSDEVNEIVEMLKQFGNIEGKNVFYWFQNFNARLKLKRKRQEFKFQNTSEPLPAARRILLPKFPPLNTSSSGEQGTGVPKIAGTFIPYVRDQRAHVGLSDPSIKVAKVSEAVGEGNNYMRDIPTEEVSTLTSSQILLDKAGGEPNRVVDCAFQSQVTRQYRRLISTPSTSVVINVRPTLESTVPPTLVLFPLHPEGLALKSCESSDSVRLLN